MPYNSLTNTFARIWRFVDFKASNDPVRRVDLDVAFDDVTAGINATLAQVASTATVTAERIAAEAAADAAEVSADAAALSASDSATSAAAAETARAAAAAEVAAAIAANMEWRGPWLTSTTYAIADLAQNGGNTYYCTTAHLSGTFATDLAAGNWQLLAAKGTAGAGTGDMLYDENLSGLTHTPTARTNLGLGLAAVQNFMPVEQGGGPGMLTNKLRLGYDGTDVRLQVDSTFFGRVVRNNVGTGAATLLRASGTAPLYGVRAFGTVGSLGTVGGGSINFASVTKVSTGVYEITFSEALPSYYIFACLLLVPRYTLLARGLVSTKARVEIRDVSNNPIDAAFNFVVVSV